MGRQIASRAAFRTGGSAIPLQRRQHLLVTHISLIWVKYKRGQMGVKRIQGKKRAYPGLQRLFWRVAALGSAAGLDGLELIPYRWCTKIPVGAEELPGHLCRNNLVLFPCFFSGETFSVGFFSSAWGYHKTLCAAGLYVGL